MPRFLLALLFLFLVVAACGPQTADDRPWTVDGRPPSIRLSTI